jgi:hypothetical protein
MIPPSRRAVQVQKYAMISMEAAGLSGIGTGGSTPDARCASVEEVGTETGGIAVPGDSSNSDRALDGGY